MEKKVLDRRSVLGRLGGAGLASAFVLATGSNRTSAQSPGEIIVMVKGTVAAGQWCGEYFIANIEFTPDADGMIDNGIFQIAEMSADLPFLEIGDECPFVGTYQGRTLDLRVEVKDEWEDAPRYISFHGVTQYVTGTEPLDNDGNKIVDVAGSFSGPIGCELGSWTTTITDDREWCDDCGCCGDTTTSAPAAVVPVVPGATTTTTTTTPEPTTTTTTTTLEPPCDGGTVIDGKCTCPTGYYLLNGKCEPVPMCPGGTVIIPDDGPAYCQCEPGYAVNANGVCVSICDLTNSEYDPNRTVQRFCTGAGVAEELPAFPGTVCFCLDGFAFDTALGLCIPELSCP